MIHNKICNLKPHKNEVVGRTIYLSYQCGCIHDVALFQILKDCHSKPNNRITYHTNSGNGSKIHESLKLITIGLNNISSRRL